MKKVPKVRVALIIFLTLVFPILLTFCLHTGKNHYKQLPVLGPKNVNDRGDTVFHKVADFTLTDEMGNNFTSKKELKENFYLIHFFYTSCPVHCPELLKKLKAIDKEYKDLEDFQMVSVTLNPSEDTPQKLSSFKDNLGIKSEKWTFLTGNKQEIRQLANEEFLITVKENKGSTPKVEHSDFFILVDKDRRIRGYYKGSERSDFKKLKDEIIVLNQEE